MRIPIVPYNLSYSPLTVDLSSARFFHAVVVLLVTFTAPFVNGVTCNSQNVIGLPYRLNGLAGLSLADFRIVVELAFIISLLPPGVTVLLLPNRPYTGLSVAFSISSLFLACIGVLHLFVCSVGVCSSFLSICVNCPSIRLGFSPLLDEGL